MYSNYSLFKKTLFTMFLGLGLSFSLGAVPSEAVTINNPVPIKNEVLVGAVNNNCTIHSFRATPSVVSTNGSTTLTWNTSNCSNIRISGGAFVNSLQFGTSVTTGPLTSPTQYTLYATGTTGQSATAYETVTVTQSVSGSCEVTSFYATPASVAYGQSSTLYYSTTGCTSVSIYPHIGPVSATSGSISTGAIYQNTPYSISATGTNGTSDSDQYTVSLSNTSGGGSSFCSITSFYSMPASVNSGQGSTLYWKTSGCSSLRISGGSLSNYSYLPAEGSLPTGAIYGTTPFTLYGLGSNSVSNTTIVSVIGGSYPVTPACNDRVDNDGDGFIDWPNDVGCYSIHDGDESNTGTATSSSIITLSASNVGSGYARLNGVLTGATGPANIYFEYGKTITLGQTTALQYVQPSGAVTFYDSINTLPNTNYYFRAVMQVNGMQIRGSIMSFTSTGITDPTTIYVRSGPSYSTKSTQATTPVADVTVTLTNTKEKIFPGETVDYTLTYENMSGKRLRNVRVMFVLPQGLSLVQTTAGTMISPSTAEIKIGELAVAEKGTIFLQATVGENVPVDETLVTNATLYYTFPNSQSDSAVGFVLNNAGSASGFGGMALGSGFFPTTVLGWFLTIIVILIIILIIRRIVKSREMNK